MEVKEKKKRERDVVIRILILMALIIIIFLFVRCLGMINHTPRVPTGNVDIFDINFSGICDCDDDTNCDITLPVIGEGDINIEDGLSVYDKDTVFSMETKLNIFTQVSYYVVDNRIAPTSENSYQFVIRNNNDFNIKYSFETKEINEFNINMKFRLKKNGNYVVGNDSEYVSIDEIKQYNINLASQNHDVYTLDWKWFESSNDTEVGTDIDSYYRLNLTIIASIY